MIDIVIVNWNGGELVKNCITSILENVESTLVNSIIIVDNASVDLSVKNLPNDPKVKLIQNSRNLGFSKACNQGFHVCTADFVLLLNPDTELRTNTLSKCINFIKEHNDVDILGVRLLDEHGKTTCSCARFPTPLRVFFDATGLSKIAPQIFTPSALMTDWNHEQSRYVDQVMGAFMFMRKSVFGKIGYFDERFFVYYEELDFSRRLALIGGKSFFNADITAIHVGCGTTQNVKAFRLFLNLRSRLQYAKKHFSIIGLFFTYISTWFIEPFSRLLFSIFKGKGKESIQVFKAYVLLLRNINKPYL